MDNPEKLKHEMLWRWIWVAAFAAAFA